MPSKVTRICRGMDCQIVCVASTCATSLAPMPKASAPSAPWLDVWLSPQTTVMPGSVRPSSGPATCTMPCLGSASSKARMPAPRAFFSKVSMMPRISGSAMASVRRARVGA